MATADPTIEDAAAYLETVDALSVMLDVPEPVACSLLEARGWRVERYSDVSAYRGSVRCIHAPHAPGPIWTLNEALVLCLTAETLRVAPPAPDVAPAVARLEARLGTHDTIDRAHISKVLPGTPSGCAWMVEVSVNGDTTVERFATPTLAQRFRDEATDAVDRVI
jgi:hypothetical protein